MTERELNIKKLKEEYKEPTYEAMAELYSEGYRNGFEQSRFDKRMLEQENQELKDRINQYENPENLTLFYMWLDTKAKDKMKQLEKENKRYKELGFKYLNEQNQQLKDRINKAIERLTLNGDVKEEDVIEVFANAIRDTRALLKGDKEW